MAVIFGGASRQTKAVINVIGCLTTIFHSN